MRDLAFVVVSAALASACNPTIVLKPFFPDGGTKPADAARPNDTSADDDDDDAPPASRIDSSVPRDRDAAMPAEQDAGPTVELPPSMAADPECDLTGYWAAKNKVINNTALAGALPTATWYFMSIAQDGELATVMEHLECGQLVKSSAEQSYPRDTLRVVTTKNSWNGRTASVKRAGANCEIEFQRVWTVRGADVERFLPAGVFATGGLEVQRTIALPTKANPDGAENWNGPNLDRPGIAGLISGLTSGTRWTTQRLYNDWFTSAAYPVLASETFGKITLAARFDAEANILSVDPPNALLESLTSEPDKESALNHVQMLLLGRSADDEGAAALVQQTDLVERCLTIQNELLPF